MKTKSQIVEWLFLNDQKHPSKLAWREAFVQFLGEDTLNESEVVNQQKEVEAMNTLSKPKYDVSLIRKTLKAYGFKKIPIHFNINLTDQQSLQVSKMLEPKFILIPPVATLDLIKAIDKHKMMDGQRDCYTFDWVKDIVQKEKTPEKWEWAIVEGKQELDADPKLMDRKLIDQYNDFTARNDLITIRQYIVLMMMALREKKPLDVKYWSVLRERDDGAVAYGRWLQSSSQAFFRSAFLAVEYDVARLRASVMGEVLGT